MISKVREFHRKFNMPCPEELTRTDRVSLREKLIEEELHEFSEAVKSEPEENIYKAADLLYVVHGYFVECGLDMKKINVAFDEVHSSNMSKLGPDGKPIHREDGKILKGPHYRPADIAKAFKQNL